MENRDSALTIPAIWAENAETDVSSPVAGTSYRDAAMTTEEVETGIPYVSPVDFSIINQTLYLATALLRQLERQGILSWCATTPYSEGSICMGADAVLYKSKQDANTNHAVSDTDWWEPFDVQDASTSSKGIVQLATAAEAQVFSASANALKAVTPFTLHNAFMGDNQGSNSNGYWQKLPGGRIIQYGFSAHTGLTANKIHNLPVAFPTACDFANITDLRPGDTGSGEGETSVLVATTRFTITISPRWADSGQFWIAIGR